MSGQDLEGLTNTVLPGSLTFEHGSRECPMLPYDISTPACESRQKMCASQGDACRVCFPGCLHFDREAHAERLKTSPISTHAPLGEAEEDKTMDVPTFDRELPEGATVSKSGKVWKNGMKMLPCPKCATNWMAATSKACGICAPRGNRSKGKAAKHSPEPKLREVKVPGLEVKRVVSKAKATEDVFQAAARAACATGCSISVGIGNPPPDNQVEALAQQLAAKVRARAAEILGLEAPQ